MAFENNVQTTLHANLAIGATTMEVAKSAAPNNDVPESGKLTLTGTDKVEIISYAGRTDATTHWTLTGVTKNAESNFGDQAWSAGDTVYQALTAGDVQELRDNAGTGTVSYALFEYTVASNGQVDFTGVDINGNTLEYTPDSLTVIRQGFTLPSSDYTATDGTTVSISAGTLQAGESVIIQAFGAGGELPDQTGNSGKYLTTNGSAASWGTVASGGGAWTEISSTTVSSAVAQIEYTLSGYSVYKILYWGCNWGSNDNSFAMDITVGSGSYSETLKFHQHRFGGANSANQNTVYAGTGSILEMWPGTRVDSSNGSNFGEITIFNTTGMPTLQVRDNLMDDTSLSVGITNAILGFNSPSSTDTIGKIKLIGSQGNNFEAGNFVLYGLN